MIWDRDVAKLYVELPQAKTAADAAYEREVLLEGYGPADPWRTRLEVREVPSVPARGGWKTGQKRAAEAAEGGRR